jgi:carboxymethylenebutenolidase
MCFDLDSRPPIEPIAGGALDSGEVILKGADGASFRAFGARPAQSTGAGVLILPDVRGLHQFFEELTLRFAEHGIAALAIDYFGRTAGTGPRPADFDHQAHVAQAKWTDIEGEIRAGIAYLRSEAGGAPRSTFALGFCMGGRLASVSATLGLGLAGVIPFYGWPAAPSRNGTPAPVDVASKIECDVFALYGAEDHAIDAAMRDTFDQALDAAHVHHKTIVYPDAGHSFFDKKSPETAKASAAAWDETLAFIRHHTAGQPIAAA